MTVIPTNACTILYGKGVKMLRYQTKHLFEFYILKKFSFVREKCEIEVHMKRSLWKCNLHHFVVFVKIVCVNLVSSLGGGYCWVITYLDGILSKSSLYLLKHTLCEGLFKLDATIIFPVNQKFVEQDTTNSQGHLAHMKCEYYQALKC